MPWKPAVVNPLAEVETAGKEVGRVKAIDGLRWDTHQTVVYLKLLWADTV